jgi:hypothetical protein
MPSSLSFVGSLTKNTSRAIDATLSFVGSLTKQTSRALAATLNFVGAFVGNKLGAGTEYFHSMNASLNFVGTLSPYLFSVTSIAIGFIKVAARPVMWVLTKVSGSERSAEAKKSEWILPN